MARTKNSPNRLKAGDPGFNLSKPKNGRKMPLITAQEQVDVKFAILDKLTKGEAKTISEAARQLEISPQRVYSWGKSDPDFREAVSATREVVADELEERLRSHGNFIPLMFLLKAYRPEFRENYRFDGVNSKMDEILAELSRKAKQPEEKKVEETKEPETTQE